MSERTLIRGGTVLTLGAKTPNHVQADVLVEGDRVAEVGQGLRARDAEQVDGTDTIVMPGFVDAHRHTWKTLFRASDATPSSEAYEPDDVYAATLLGLLGAAETGITSVVDWADVPPGCTDAALQAHADAGVRTVFVAVHDLPSAVPASVTIAYGGADWESARGRGLRIHSHAVGPGDTEGMALAADVTLAGCANLTDADLEAVAGAGASVVLTPSTDMARGLGLPPLQQLIDRGIRPGLGIDDELIAPADQFAQMRAVHAAQHAGLFQRKLAGKAGVPSLLSTREVIRYATVDGARAAGLGEITGSIESGKQADIILLRTDRPNITPVNDPIGAVVWGMDPSNVDWVFVAGRPVMRHGELDADVGRVRDLAEAARRRLAEAAGDLVGGSR